MKYFLFTIIFNCQVFTALSQWSGQVTDIRSGEPLISASITFYSNGKISGTIANKEGKFSLTRASYDSLKISMIGYRSKTIYQNVLLKTEYLKVELEPAPSELEEVIVNRSNASEIISKAIDAIPSFQPDSNFENTGFYRETIRNKGNYFSVAEAVFSAQYFPKKHSYRLKLIQGRSKEDVAYTRLFEDFHPGGGPQSVADKNFLIEHPDFFNKKKINFFNFKIDSLVQFDGHWLYSISFDQKPEVKQALEKGRILIDADSYAVIRYEAQNSPLGIAYIKSLTGSDKVFAEILNIDLQRKGWKRIVEFSLINNRWIMSHAETEYAMDYKQPKKNLDLDLTINTELLFSELDKPISKEISKDEEWKQKNIVANLPTDFDTAFWGGNNVISPTEEIKNIITKISMSNNDVTGKTFVNGWQYLNSNLFVSYKNGDTITLIPIMRSLWEDDETGGMLFNEMEGNFVIETRIDITKNTDRNNMPDRGFQQGGIIIKSANDERENYVLLSLGTGGNSKPKLFFKRTNDNKSKTVANKNDDIKGWLRLEKKDNKVAAFFKSDKDSVFKKTGEYELAWLRGKLQVGLVVFAAFAGDGPKMRPDMRANFSQLKISNQ